jgi:hypothetical protein
VGKQRRSELFQQGHNDNKHSKAPKQLNERLMVEGLAVGAWSVESANRHVSSRLRFATLRSAKQPRDDHRLLAERAHCLVVRGLEP